jgi:predicted deacetylase
VKARTLAVALHDVEPGTLERCALIRQWLAERGVDRVTLLAIPHAGERKLEPDGACADWLRIRMSDGDAIAQHGMHHHRRHAASRSRDWLADRQGGDAAEFVGLTARETVDAVDAGRALLAAAGVEPRGFVAPAYAYTPALRRAVRSRFSWYGGLLAVQGARPLRVPAHGLGTSTTFKRRTSPAVLWIGSSLATTVVRLDVHPADFDHPRHIAALDGVLDRAAGRRPVTYDELTG